MTKPSKELLSKVLKKDIKDIYEIGSNPNFSDSYLLYSVFWNGDLNSINIHELLHLMKIWIWKQKYFVVVIHRIGGLVEVEVGRDEHSIFGVEHFYNKAELDAIIQACEWIKDNHD